MQLSLDKCCFSHLRSTHFRRGALERAPAIATLEETTLHCELGRSIGEIFEGGEHELLPLVARLSPHQLRFPWKGMFRTGSNSHLYLESHHGLLPKAYHAQIIAPFTQVQCSCRVHDIPCSWLMSFIIIACLIVLLECVSRSTSAPPRVITVQFSPKKVLGHEMSLPPSGESWTLVKLDHTGTWAVVKQNRDPWWSMVLQAFEHAKYCSLVSVLFLDVYHRDLRKAMTKLTIIIDHTRHIRYP